MTIYKEGLPESYTLYKGLNGTLSSSLYRKIIKAYYAKVIDKIIYNNLDYHFNYIGSVYLTKVKPKLKVGTDGLLKPSLPIDWVNTKKFKKLIYLTNSNRYGYVFRIKWNKLGAKRSSQFKFYPERYNFKRYLSKILMNEDVKIDAPILSDAYYINRT